MVAYPTKRFRFIWNLSTILLLSSFHSSVCHRSPPPSYPPTALFVVFSSFSLSLCIFALYFFCNFLFSLPFASTLLCTASLSTVVFSTSGKAQRWVGLNFEMEFQTTAHTPRVSVHFEWEVQMIKRDRWCVYGMSLLASPGLSSSWWPSAAAVAAGVALFVHETSESFLHPFFFLTLFSICLYPLQTLPLATLLYLYFCLPISSC